MTQPGPSRLAATWANGQLAFGHYLLDAGQGSYLGHSLDVLTLRGSRIAVILAFRVPHLFGSRRSWAIPLVWAVLVVGVGDTVNAIIQSMRYSVFTHPPGVNWVIVTIYVPALLVSSALILWQLVRSPAAASLPAAAAASP